MRGSFLLAFAVLVALMFFGCDSGERDTESARRVGGTATEVELVDAVNLDALTLVPVKRGVQTRNR